MNGGRREKERRRFVGAEATKGCRQDRDPGVGLGSTCLCPVAGQVIGTTVCLVVWGQARSHHEPSPGNAFPPCVVQSSLGVTAALSLLLQSGVPGSGRRDQPVPVGLPPASFYSRASGRGHFSSGVDCWSNLDPGPCEPVLFLVTTHQLASPLHAHGRAHTYTHHTHAHTHSSKMCLRNPQGEGVFDV